MVAMASSFHYQDPFPLGADTTKYRLLTKEHVSVAEFAGQPVLKVAPAALTLLANQALHDINFYLRTGHLAQVAAILADPEASDNDRAVALAMLRNAEVAAKGVLPFCQDTGTAQVVAKKGQQVWTGGGDAEALSLGVYQAYAQNNLRYSQNAPLDMFREVNTGIMVIPPNRLPGWLSRLSNANAQQEYYLTDLVALAVADGVPVCSATACPSISSSRARKSIACANVRSEEEFAFCGA